MVRICKIYSRLFPYRYKQFTDFHATYGYIAIENYTENRAENNELTFYLDPRYDASAQAAGIKFLPIQDLPKEGVILDPWEWSIAEFEGWKFVDPKFENFENYDDSAPVPMLAEDDLKKLRALGKKYLVSNFWNIKAPCKPYVLSDQVMLCDDYGDVYYDPTLTPLAYYKHLSPENRIADPLKLSDAIIDNPQDMQEYKNFLHKDAQAWMKLWKDAENAYVFYHAIQLGEKFNEIKAEIHGDDFEEAFNVIVGNNADAAQIHGTPNNKQLQDGVLLIDAGSKCGWMRSDITRVFWLGNKQPNEKVRAAYTSVLKAFIAVARMEFDRNAHGSVIDKEARKFVQFAHALGHGVGKHDVHAFPAIRGDTNTVLQENMILAIEPGVYYNNEFGVRLEGLMRVKSIDADRLGFELLTYIPFEYNLTNYDQFTAEEKAWLKKFHQQCFMQLSDCVDVAFLNKKTASFC